MKKMPKSLIVLSLVLCISCGSLQNRNSNSQSDIINILLERAEKSRDSIYIIDLVSKTESMKYNESSYMKNKILAIKNDAEEFDDFKKILTKQGINYDQELSYFKKQLQNPVPIDKSKIKIEKVRFFPSNTDSEKLLLDKNFKPINYYYDLPKIVFTKDGNNAIVYQKNRESANHFALFKRVEGKWKGTIDILDKPSGIE